MIVVDANVLVKAIVPELGSDAAERLLYGDEPVLVPAHAMAEVFEVLSRHCLRDEMDHGDLARAHTVMMPFVSTADLEPLLLAACDIAVACRVSVYDALYVALAIKLDALFVTADMRLIRALAETPHAGRLVPLAAVTFPLPMAP